MPQAPSSAPSPIRAEQPVALERTRQRQLPVLGGGEAESANRARRPAGSPRGWPRASPPRALGSISAAPTPEAGGGCSTASGPSMSAGIPPTLDVPQPHGPDQAALAHGRQARPSAGARPSRRRWHVQHCGCRQSRHPAAPRAQRRPRPAPHGSRTEQHRG